jgi:glutamyl-tRNA reductase
LAAELALADVLVTCTGAVGTVLSAGTVAEALGRRDTDRPLVICDLGLPRDVAAEVAQLPGIVMVDLATLNERLAGRTEGDAVRAVREIVADEVAHYLSAQRSELLRMTGRLPDLRPEVRDELASTVRRVVDKLLHTPTVRVKQLAEAPGGDTYAEALRELFGLDPQAPAAVTTPRAAGAGGAGAGPAAGTQRVDGIALDQIPTDGLR